MSVFVFMGHPHSCAKVDTVRHRRSHMLHNLWSFRFQDVLTDLSVSMLQLDFPDDPRLCGKITQVHKVRLLSHTANPWCTHVCTCIYFTSACVPSYLMCTMAHVKVESCKVCQLKRSELTNNSKLLFAQSWVCITH